MAKKNLLFIGVSGGIGQKLLPYLNDYHCIGHYSQHNPPSPEDVYQADITRYQEVEQMVASIIQRFTTIDVVINASGVSVDSFTHKFDSEEWKKVIDVNLVGVFNVIRAVLPHMRTANYGRIINLSSVVGQRPVIGTSAYSASKSALTGFVKTVAIENSGKGITCNNIALGYFEAGMMYRIPPNVQEEIVKSIPMKRLGTMKELYSAIEFIVNTEYFTGQTLNLNGGLI